MASVYLATDLRLERQVAVKVLLPNLARDPSLAERFDREARTLASVAHPSIAEVFDVERGEPESGREPFYVMELCEGGSLADRIEASGPLEPGELVPLVVVVSAAIAELHRHGLIHRDVKPANILFTGGRPKLADFGLAKAGARPGYYTLTEPGTAIGTPAYMAPELVAGGQATFATDVYALAATTFHGLTGRAPRPSETLSGLAATLTEAIPSVSSVSPRLGAAFDPIITAALSEDPGARPSLGAFTAGLVAALAGTGVPVAAPALDTPTSVDPMAETTRVAVAGPPTRIGPDPAIPAVARTRRPPERPARRRLPLAGLLPAAFLIGLLLAVPAAVALWLAGGRPSPTPAASPVPSPTPIVFPTPSVASSPTATPDPAAVALGKVDVVIAAIDQARGGPDGLSGNQAHDLLALVDDVRSKLQEGNFEEARKIADRLLKDARKAVDHIDDERGDRIVSSIGDLIDAIPR